MSIENVRKFLKKAEDSPELQKKLKSIPKSGGESSVAEIVKLASESGFSFTAKDYVGAVEQMLEEKHAASALTDSELALISGGLMCVSSDGTKKCTCCSSPIAKTATVSRQTRTIG
jgi:predicted ribosomally synthesized peptide with nif11-like leader